MFIYFITFIFMGNSMRSAESVLRLATFLPILAVMGGCPNLPDSGSLDGPDQDGDGADGDDDSTVETKEQWMTRQQLVETLLDFNDVNCDPNAVSSCNDVPPEDQADWACAEELGWVGGYSDADGNSTGSCGPNDSVLRAEGAKVTTVAQGLPVVPAAEAPYTFDDVDPETWYADYVASLATVLPREVLGSAEDSDLFEPASLLREQDYLDWLDNLPKGK